MLKKSQIFYFFSSFTITLVVGIFLWNIFANPINNAGISPASLSYSEIINDIPATDLGQEGDILDEGADTEDQGLIILTEQQRQDLLDDIQEKLDLISQQVQELVLEQNQDNQVVEPEVLTENESTADDEIDQEQNSSQEESNSQTVESASYMAGGGSGATIYPKILISEVQIASASDSKQEFVELFNPNNQDIDLTHWYLQRKTSGSSSWATYASNGLFLGKTISANGYLLIAREGYYPGLADIFVDNPITDNNSLALKNPNGDISDKLGFGNALDYELLATASPSDGQSIGRKVLPDGTEEETDNNLNDFEIDTPTPKAQNVKWIEPPAPSDITTPEVNFTLASAQESLGFTVNFTIADPILDTVSSSGISSYIFRWQEQGLDWQTDASISVDGSPVSLDFVRDFNGEDGKTYNFQIQAIDTAGNISDWLPITPATTTVVIPVVLKAILINEIQIAPIEQRFVELYNPNSSDIDMTGYYLQRKTKTADSWASFVSSTNFEGKTISAGGYFLISREIADSDILLDITLGDNNSLALKNPDREIIDKVGWGEAIDPEGIPAPSPEESKSITRTAGIDTDDNSTDFIILDTPTPKGE